MHKLRNAKNGNLIQVGVAKCQTKFVFQGTKVIIKPSEIKSRVRLLTQSFSTENTKHKIFRVIVITSVCVI